MHTKSGSIICSSSWTRSGSYCCTSWSHWRHTNMGFKYSTFRDEMQTLPPPTTPNPHLSLHGVWQEAAHFPHSLLNLGFSRILLQDAVNVRHGGLANLTVATDNEASLVQCS